MVFSCVWRRTISQKNISIFMVRMEMDFPGAMRIPSPRKTPPHPTLAPRPMLFHLLSCFQLNPKALLRLPQQAPKPSSSSTTAGPSRLEKREKRKISREERRQRILRCFQVSLSVPPPLSLMVCICIKLKSSQMN